MTVLTASTTIQAAHVVHYTVLGAGLVGLLYLLLPGLAGPARRGSRPATPRDEHEARVEALRGALARHGQSQSATGAPRTTSEPRGILVEVAVVGSMVAAAVHAIVCPEHFEERFLFGLFFAVCSVVQLIWAFAVLRRPTRPLWVVGAVGNFAVVGLWTITRVEGLPWGLLPIPEGVGVWDMIASGAEIVVLVACVTACLKPVELSRPAGQRRRVAART